MKTDQICRVCMTNDEQHMHSVFEDGEIDGNDIAIMLSTITKYKVHQNDKMPHFICNKCMAGARSAYQFKLKCEQSYQILRTMIYAKCSSLPLKDNQLQENEAFTDKSTQTTDDMLETLDEIILRDDYNADNNFDCRLCNKSYNNCSDLNTHLAEYHPETEPNRCNMCDREFTRREHMRRHLAVIHKIVDTVEDPKIQTFREKMKTKTKNIEILEINSRLRLDKCVKNEESDNIIPAKDIKIDKGNADNSNNNVFLDTGDSELDTTLDETEETSKDLEDKDILHKEFIKVLPDESGTNPLEGIEDLNLNEDCDEQNRTLSSEINKTIRRNEKRILKDKPINKCEYCDRTFQHRKSLKRHLMNHNKDLEELIENLHNASKEIKCEECDKMFINQAQLKRHIEAKHGDKIHKCEICEKTFSTKVYLQRHLVIHEKKRYNCKECVESYMTRKELNDHIKAEGHDKPMLCPECGLRCKTKNILMVHIRRHSGEKPYKCKFCSKGFPRMDDLRVHERYHTNEKSHFCETCGKGFQRKYNLTIHLRVHTGERPYKCPHCSQAFTQGNDLKAHIRRHTGERFRCDICSAAFLQGYQIRNHKLIEHGIKETPPTQRVAKFTSPEEQEQQIKQNLQREMTQTEPNLMMPENQHQSW